MGSRARMSGKNQIVIPKALREQLKIGLGTKLQVTKITPTRVTFTVVDPVLSGGDSQPQYVSHLGAGMYKCRLVPCVALRASRGLCPRHHYYFYKRASLRKPPANVSQ